MIPKNSTILFQGDSITDCGRNRDAASTPNDLSGLGQGYAMMGSDGVHPSAAGHLLMAKC
jgi:phospholipase/lecithinase/hemolysin